MEEENSGKRIKQALSGLGKNIVKVLVSGPLGLFLPFFLIILAIAIIAGMILYHLTIDDAMYKEGDWGSVPYAFMQYSLDVNIAKDGTITTKKNAQEIWDEIIKNKGPVADYLNNAGELKRLMDAQLVTQFPDTRKNPDEKIDWKKFFSYRFDVQNTNTYTTVNSESTLNVLFVGNSKTDVNNVPSLFTYLSKSLGKSVYVDSCTRGGKSLNAFIDESELNRKLVDKVKSRKWDYIVLQEQTDAALRIDSVKSGTSRIIDYVKNNSNKDVKVIYKVWGIHSDFNEAEYYQTTQCFEEARNQYGGNIAYIANALLKCHEVHPTINLYTDNVHATMEGSYLATCCVYSAIFGEKTEGAKYAPCDARIATLLQQISDDVMKVTEVAEESDKIQGELTSEIQGIVKIKRAMSDGTIKTLTYVDPDTFDFYVNSYNDTGSEEEKEFVLNHFSIGVNKGTSSRASGVSLAGFTTEDFLQSVRDVAKNVYQNRNIFRYGNSSTTPPCEWETDPRDGSTVKFIACDRLVSKALYNLGVTDMDPGGLNVTNENFLISHGFKKITDQNDLQPGDIIIFGSSPERWLHTFVLESYNKNTQTCSKYDMGSDARIQTQQPFVNVPFDEWDNKDFVCAFRVNYVPQENVVDIDSTDGLGRKRDITETTLDKDNNHLLTRMQSSLRGSSYSNLSYLIIPYYDFNNNVQQGEMVVNKEVADEVLLIFQELYKAKYPIEEMSLVDKYGASDWQSIQHNNTSAFNYRRVNNGQSESANLSNHAFGYAIDINPLVNPYIINYYSGTPYTTHRGGKDNTDSSPNYNDKFILRDSMTGWTDVEKRARIARNTKIYEIFTKYNWSWLERAGNSIDSQHFEKIDKSNIKAIDWSKVPEDSSTGADSNSNRGANVSQSSPFTKYQLTDAQLTGLAAVAYSEQGTLRGAATEASLMANLFELQKNGSYNGKTGGEGLYNYVGHGGWFAQASSYIDSGHLAGYAGGGAVTAEMKEVVKTVLVDGKRTIPGYIDEHDSWSGKDYSASQDGRDVTGSRESYVQYSTHIRNNYGSSYTFWGWADPDYKGSDPFGYTSEENRAKIGEFYFDFSTGTGIGDAQVATSETTYYLKIGAWNETITRVSTNDPDGESYTKIDYDMSNKKINYQDYLSGYKIPFNYLWALLVVSDDKDFVFDVADLVYNSEIELTIHDNYSENTSSETEKYVRTVTTTNSKGETVERDVTYTKTTTITTKNTNIVPAITKANVWAAEYTKNFTYEKTDNGSRWKEGPKIPVREKTDKYADEDNFVKVLARHRTAKKAFNDSASWLWEIMEQEQNKISDLIDLTKYLFYKTTGRKYDNIDEFDFEIFNPDNFKKTTDGFVGSNLEEKIWWMLKDIGYSDFAAAGVMGNLSAETDDGSSIHSEVEEKGGTGIGIAQWSFGRHKAIEKYALSKGKTWKDEEIQLEFLKAELTGGGCNGLADDQCYNKALQSRFLASTNPEEAADLFEKLFERSGGSRMDVRRKGAIYYYNMFQGKQRPTSGSMSGNLIVDTADKYVGNPYVWGGNSLTNGCDCSHFIRLVLIECGLIPPSAEYHTTSDMNSGRLRDWGAVEVDPSQAQAGDIVLYGTSGIHHVAFYDGNGMIVEAKGSAYGITHDRTMDHEGVAAVFRVGQ